MSNIYVGILLIVISIPLVMRKVPMNKLYGVRLKKSFESDENWYKINAYGGKHLILWATVLVLIGIGTSFIPLEEDSRTITLIASTPALIFIPVMIAIFRYARKL